MTGESGGYLLRMEGLCRSYRKQPALSGFSGEIELDRGLIYGLIGPNGSGKTTLLKLLAGILIPSGGCIFREGAGREKKDRAKREVSFPAWSRENVVYIPAGERGLRYKNTVRDNVLYLSALKGRNAEETKALLTRYASFLRCEALLDRRVETLSLGQKKKASLLCGLCAGARLILMDEPEGGLDLKESLQYRTGLLTDAAIFVGSFLAAFFLGSGSSLTSFYRADATQGIMLLLIGYLFWGNSSAALGYCTGTLQGEMERGIFEMRLQSRYPLTLLLFCRLLASTLLHFLVYGVLLAAAALLTGSSPADGGFLFFSLLLFLPSACGYSPALSDLWKSACGCRPVFRLFPGRRPFPFSVPARPSALSGGHVRHEASGGRGRPARKENGQPDLSDPDRPALCHQYAYSHRSGSPVSDPLLLRHRHRPPPLSVRIRFCGRLGRIPSHQSGLVPFGERRFRALHETGTKDRSMGYLLMSAENIRSAASHYRLLAASATQRSRSLSIFASTVQSPPSIRPVFP